MKKFLFLIILTVGIIVSQISYTESSIIEKIYTLKNKNLTFESSLLINDGVVYIKLSDCSKLFGQNFQITDNSIEITDDSKSVNNKKYYENGDIYVGNLVNGVRSGFGTLYINDGGKYEGYWKNDKYNGNGFLLMKDGSFYEGNFLDGFIHGEGVYTYSTGDTYNGSFEYGIKSGFGKYYSDPNNKYTGYWKNGLRDGKGNGIVNGFPRRGVWEKDKLIKILTASQFDFDW